MRRFLLLLLAVLLGAAVPVVAAPDAASDESDNNRRLLDHYRADPDHYRRLLADLRAFQTLPAGRQGQMRRFDRELHELEPGRQNHLWDVLVRYTDWVNALPPDQQKLIDDAPDEGHRIAVVKDLRQKDWLARLPQKDRDAVAAMPPDQQATRLAEYRKQEQRRRQEWAEWAANIRPDAPRPYRPQRLSNLRPPAALAYLNEVLRPALNEEEQKQLKDADGKWPQLALTLLELCEKHPYLPPGPKGPVTKYDQLPDEAKQALAPDRLKKAGVRDEFRGKEGKWPDYALAVADVMKHEKADKPPPLGASRPDEFSAEVRDAVAKLKEADRATLRDLEGRWPEYPQTLIDLARRNNVPLPGMTQPPGPPAVWAAAYDALPPLDHWRLNIAYYELDAEGKAAYNALGPDETERKEFLKEQYFKKHPDQLPRPRRRDK